MKKENRIKRNEEIAEIIQSKLRIYSDNFTIYYRFNSDNYRVAISVSKKYGNAVERNYAKRIVREAIHKTINKYGNMDAIFVVKKDLRAINFEQIVKEVDDCLKKIHNKLKNQMIEEDKWEIQN